MREAGYDIDTDPRSGLFEIRGVPSDLIEQFSQRSGRSSSVRMSEKTGTCHPPSGRHRARRFSACSNWRPRKRSTIWAPSCAQDSPPMSAKFGWRISVPRLKSIWRVSINPARLCASAAISSVSVSPTMSTIASSDWA
ncbi:MAG: relaxase domain-containing protein [Sphingobium sp.]